jgi:hypothetical protein
MSRTFINYFNNLRSFGINSRSPEVPGDPRSKEDLKSSEDLTTSRMQLPNSRMQALNKRSRETTNFQNAPGDSLLPSYLRNMHT